MYVVKRDGRHSELDLSQIRKQTVEACNGLRDVSPEDIENNLGIFVYSGISTKEIQEALIRSAIDLASIDKPDYVIAAGRLMLYDIYHTVKRLHNKQGSGDVYKKVTLKDYIRFNKDVLSDFIYKYTDEELEELDKCIDSSRDNVYTCGAVSLMKELNLIKNNGVISELPQHMYMSIAMFIMQNENDDKRLEYVKELYEATSKLEYINPTPVNSNARLKYGGLISCLINTLGDSIESVFNKYTEIGFGSKIGAGWGVDVSSLRSIRSPININKEGSSGKIPFIKVINDILIAVNQNGKSFAE